MQNPKFLIALLAVGFLPQAFAADPPAAAADQTTAAAPASVTPSVSAAAPVSSTAPASSVATADAAAPPTAQVSDADAAAAARKAADEEQAKRLRMMGYKAEVSNGHTIYCKREAVVGQRIPTYNCGSGDQIEQRTHEAKDQLTKYQIQGLQGPISR
jgi:hypothetical protein